MERSDPSTRRCLWVPVSRAGYRAQEEAVSKKSLRGRLDPCMRSDPTSGICQVYVNMLL